MSINTISTNSKAVINRVCDLRDEFTNDNKAYREVRAKHQAALEAIKAALPEKQKGLLLDAEEYQVQADVMFQEALYVQGLLDGAKYGTDDGDLSKYPDVLMVEDITKYLRMGRVQAYNLVRRQDFPKIIEGRRIRIPKSAFEKWLNTTALNNK